MPDIAVVNGRLFPLSQARVPVEDRGLQFGDGVYEVLRTYGGRIFHLEDHLNRLEASARAIRLDLPHSREQWARWLQWVVRASGYASAKVYLQVTRGPAPRNHAFPSRCRPTWILTVRRLRPLPRALREQGAAAVTVPDIRWARCDVKSTNLLANVLAQQQAREAGAHEAIFIRNGRATEGSASNVFAVIGGRVITPPKGPALLPGITREVLLRLGRGAGLPMVERSLSLENLRRAEELFLSGTTIEVLPVVRLDGKRVGRGRPGPVTRRLASLFREYTRQTAGERSG